MEKLLLVDNVPIIIKGIQHLLKNEGVNDLTIDAVDTLDQMEERIKIGTYELVIVGLQIKMMGVANAIMKMAKRYPSIPILVFTENVGAVPIRKMYQAGVCGMLDKNVHLKELLVAIAQIRKGRKYINTQVALGLLHAGCKPRHNSFGKLCIREKEVARNDK